MYENSSDLNVCQTKIQPEKNFVPSPNEYENQTFFSFASNTPEYLLMEQEKELIRIVVSLVNQNKGLFAVDESIGLLAKRFQKLNVENTEENRRLYRQIFFNCSKQLAQHFSAVTFSHEGFYQNDDHDKLFRDVLRENNIFTGIKVDKGLVPLAGTDGEWTTQGLDGLAERCGQYYRDGARFMTWRSLFKIGRSLPSDLSRDEISNLFARFASICQQNKLVPILQPEFLSEGDHDLETSQRAMEKVLGSIYVALHKHYVFLEGTLLNIEMISPGMNCAIKPTAEEIAEATLIMLQRVVPPAVPAIYFSMDNQSWMSLTFIERYKGRKPWRCKFSFGRKLQIDVLTKWNGEKTNVSAAENEFLQHIEMLHDQIKEKNEN